MSDEIIKNAFLTIHNDIHLSDADMQEVLLQPKG